MSELNSNTYNSPDVVRWYDELTEISPAEKKIFENFSEILRNGNVLDIGIGGGRTTSYLLPKCGSYTGIDFSQAFITVCKKKFSSATILLMDARDLSSFKNETFDLVNFSFNGIDYVNADGRVKILTEIQRVLKPGGVFFFSTHNMQYPTFNSLPWKRKGEGFFYNFKTFLKFSPFLFRKFKNKGLEYFSKDYAVINDHAHDFRLLTFYSSPDHIRKQLDVAGFKQITLFNNEGRSCEDKELSDWIFVTCNK